MNYTTLEIWGLILCLGVGTFLIRFSFIGMLGHRDMPEWILRHLRYAPVAVLPGLVAPLVLWPAATDGTFDAARALAALATLILGLATKSTIWAITAGAVTLYAMLYFMG